MVVSRGGNGGESPLPILFPERGESPFSFFFLKGERVSFLCAGAGCFVQEKEEEEGYW
jgi:hypothetical protein